MSDNSLLESRTVNSDLARDADSGPHDRGFQFSLRRLFFWISCIGIAMAIFVALADAVRTARHTAISMNSAAHLNQLQLAFHNYHQAYGQFPPAFIADDNGTPMHSWRVLILPYIEQQALYNAYDFSEPWNGPKKLTTGKPDAEHLLFTQ